MKVIFDATFGEPMVDAIRGIFAMHKAPSPKITHVHNEFGRDRSDDEWIPNLLGKNWIIISGDKGNKKSRLPQICWNERRTHIIISPTIHDSGNFDRACAFFMVWPQIVKYGKGPKGMRYTMSYTTGEKVHVHLVKKPHAD
ncbi:MAG: hypothetical protein IID30_12580 [Planctomycetes bacterium]|nr:hypothetical protein [Planctomycetota bacterium]